MRVIWSPISLQRIEEIVEFISPDSPTLARKVVTSIFGAVDRLKKFPKSGRILPEVGRRDLREIIKIGYRIVYRVERNRIVVLTVRHSRQEISIGEMVHARDTIVADDPMKGPIME